MNANNGIANAKPQRKQLSDQLDRLDGIIDALADGLNRAVADAAREGSRAAVKEILTELLTNPEILTMIRSAVGSVAPAPVSPPTPVTYYEAPPAPAPGIVATAVDAVADAVKTVARTVTDKAAAAWGVVKDAGRAVRESPRLKKIVLIGAGIGVVTAAIVATNHTMASALSGFGAAATAIGFQIGCWFRGAGRRLGLVLQ